MQITFEIPDRLVDNEFGYVDVRFHKDGKHINHVTTCDYESPYFAELPFIVSPKGHELTMVYPQVDGITPTVIAVKKSFRDTWEQTE